MKIIDTHCDALFKMQHAKRGKYYNVKQLNFQSAETLETNMDRLTKGNVMIQFFAVFIYPDVPSDEKWQHALEQIDLFYTEVLTKNPQMKHIKKWSDINMLKEYEIGAVLTLEGADAFGNDLGKLRQLYRLGVLSIGLTWNNANLCADGVEEPRGGGLTMLGKDVVRLNNENSVLTDVSHASIDSFWDIIGLADYPVASHSNAREICNHQRNLNDEQIKAIFAKKGLIHLVFYPPLIKFESEHATMSDLIKHIDYLCALGGVDHIGFGSDFDGINCFVEDLEDASKYQNLINSLLKYYTEEEVKGFAHQNFLKRLPKG